jgi:ABC-type transport system substrate-binding protein
MLSSIVRYDYDARRASQLLEELGYPRGTDGAHRDLAGQRLAVEIRTITADSNQKAVLAVADFWQRAGVAADPVIIPVQRSQDREYRASYPGFMLERQPNRTTEVARYHSSQTPTAENRYSGTWRPGYRNEQFDSLIERFVTTIPMPERMQVLGQIAHHMTDQLIMMGLFYDATPAMISSRMQHVSLAGNSLDLTWNAHEWDVKNDRR